MAKMKAAQREFAALSRPVGTLNPFLEAPAVETAGYFQMSLRDKEGSRHSAGMGEKRFPAQRREAILQEAHRKWQGLSSDSDGMDQGWRGRKGRI